MVQLDLIPTLLTASRSGSPKAIDQLVNTLYQELKKVARYQMRQERPDHTLQATALVHEAYLRLMAGKQVEWQDKNHFFAVAARQLRRILVNHARDREAQKRGGRQVKVTLSAINARAETSELDVLDLHRALSELELLDSRSAQVVELRYFGGLTDQETADILNVSVATVKRDWDFARVWLLKQIGKK